MKKRSMIIVMALMAAMLALGLSGCDSADVVTFEGDVTTAYVNGDYVASGDESLPALVTPPEKESLECPEGEQYMALLVGLQKVPESLAGEETMVTDKIQFNEVYFGEATAEGVSAEDGTGDTFGTVFVDLQAGKSEADAAEGPPQLAGGGSLEEGLLISQIVESLLHSFEEVDQVQFLIDGQIVESLMGHFDATGPYTEGIYTLDVE